MTNPTHMHLHQIVVAAHDQFAPFGPKIIDGWDTTQVESVNNHRTMLAPKRFCHTTSYELRSYLASYLWNNGYESTLRAMLRRCGFVLDPTKFDALIRTEKRLNVSRAKNRTEAVRKRKYIHRRTQKERTELESQSDARRGIEYGSGIGIALSGSHQIQLFREAGLAAHTKGYRPEDSTKAKIAANAAAATAAAAAGSAVRRKRGRPAGSTDRSTESISDGSSSSVAAVASCPPLPPRTIATPLPPPSIPLTLFSLLPLLPARVIS